MPLRVFSGLVTQAVTTGTAYGFQLDLTQRQIGWYSIQ